MNLTQALKIVLRAAEAHASGNVQCLEIHRAVEKVKELTKVVKKGQGESVLELGKEQG